MMVGVFTLEHGSTFYLLTIVHWLDKYDGWRLYIGPRVGVFTMDQGLTSSLLTIVHSLDKHDGRRLS